MWEGIIILQKWGQVVSRGHHRRRSQNPPAPTVRSEGRHEKLFYSLRGPNMLLQSIF